MSVDDHSNRPATFMGSARSQIVLTAAIIISTSACREREPARIAAPPAQPEARPPLQPVESKDRSALDDARLARLLRDADAHGAVLVTDMSTGAVVASAAIGRDVAAPVMSLSVIKLYVAALWWE